MRNNFLTRLVSPTAKFMVLSSVGSLEIYSRNENSLHRRNFFQINRPFEIIFHCWSRLQVIYMVNILEVATMIFEEKLQIYLM
ncbi:hypothetical protein TcasGA2_TC032988 [Tribolium castaneum]|uniref:Uncharacterized protein n=1 Tax=Tribolium castaneum TaxID=7070 RepID=A0A139WIG9_TRICA|nr:hypothetical protein TcasGA2_TC032988 [Tribolium castaneum]